MHLNAAEKNTGTFELFIKTMAVTIVAVMQCMLTSLAFLIPFVICGHSYSKTSGMVAAHTDVDVKYVQVPIRVIA